jgi:predicted GNAT family acetyltransferase
MKIFEDPENHRYVAEDDDAIVGVTVYHMAGGRHIFVHTEIDPTYTGKGVGSALARYALDDVKSKGGSIVPLCPFIAGWIEQHSEYGALIDQALLDRINLHSQAGSASS